jgi:hypothetical protein
MYHGTGDNPLAAITFSAINPELLSLPIFYKSCCVSMPRRGGLVILPYATIKDMHKRNQVE